MSKRPNVIVLFPDQLRAQSLPLFGETQIDTPHIDRLASEGTLLTQAVSNCPVCTPARAMLLTGRYSTRFGFEFTPVPDQFRPILQQLTPDCYHW